MVGDEIVGYSRRFNAIARGAGETVPIERIMLFSEPPAPNPGSPVPPLSDAVHFVGFRDDRYWNAVRVFGLPDFIHRGWDLRAQREIAPGDTIVFADGTAD